jgi:hypothetical protein
MADPGRAIDRARQANDRESDRVYRQCDKAQRAAYNKA